MRVCEGEGARTRARGPPLRSVRVVSCRQASRPSVKLFRSSVSRHLVTGEQWRPVPGHHRPGPRVYTAQEGRRLGGSLISLLLHGVGLCMSVSQYTSSFGNCLLSSSAHTGFLFKLDQSLEMSAINCLSGVCRQAFSPTSWSIWFSCHLLSQCRSSPV